MNACPNYWFQSWRRPAEVFAIITMLAVHVFLLVDGIFKHFVTVDESGHLAAGLYHWQAGCYDMYQVNPPLPRMLAVLPALADPDIPSILPVASGGWRNEFTNARLHAYECGPYYLHFLRLARLAGIFWSVLGAWIVYCWSHRLYGRGGGLISLALWCFSPNVLAHGQMATPDLPATVAGLAATYQYWHYLRSPTWLDAILAGFLLGIALLCKLTLLVLFAIWSVLWIIQRFQTQKSTRPRTLHGCAMIFLSLLVLNLGYGFDQTCKPLGDFQFFSELLANRPIGNRFRDTSFRWLPVPVPAEYLRGIDMQRYEFEHGYFSYLMGEWRSQGWWYYYLIGLTLKVPLSTWCLILIGLVLLIARRPSGCCWRDDLTLWLPVVVILGLVSSQIGFNHHLRYVLPLFPYAFIAAGRTSWLLYLPKWRLGWIAPVLVLVTITTTVRIHPHHLSYFNELAGGPNHGHDYLLDSNIDWGQDLLFLKQWLNDHPEAYPLGLAHFNFVDPSVVGITEYFLPQTGNRGSVINSDELLKIGPRPGYFAIDVNFLRGTSFIAPNGKGEINAVGMHAYEYFQHFQPIAKAGYSIYIYHITLEDANRFRREWGLPLLTDGTTSTENKP
ncbi:MAG: ArnT family glycosyltransferase [Gemmataceae bacterium]